MSSFRLVVSRKKKNKSFYHWRLCDTLFFDQFHIDLRNTRLLTTAIKKYERKKNIIKTEWPSWVFFFSRYFNLFLLYWWRIACPLVYNSYTTQVFGMSETPPAPGFQCIFSKQSSTSSVNISELVVWWEGISLTETPHNHYKMLIYIHFTF